MDGQFSCYFQMDGGDDYGGPYAPSPDFSDFEFGGESIFGQLSLSSYRLDDEHGYAFLHFSEIVFKDQRGVEQTVTHNPYITWRATNDIWYNGVTHLTVASSAFGASACGLMNIFYWPCIE